MAASYIPTTDADYNAFFSNFQTLIDATPTAYGLVTADATIITAAWTAWNAAYLLATNPTTRTSPNIAAKDAQRASSIAVIRPYAQIVSKNSGIDPALITGLGLNLANPTRPPIPAPLTNPSFTLVGQTVGQATFQYKDTSLGSTKKKPTGSIGLQVFIGIGTVPAIDPDQCVYYQTWTKSPNVAVFESGSKAKTATFFGRWVTKSGPNGTQQFGPWSDPLSFIVM